MEIFEYGFMIRALIASTIIGIVCPLMGVFIVSKKLSLIGDSLSHIALSGIAASFILNINPLIGALLASSIAAIIIEILRKTYKEYADLSIAIIMAVGVGVSGILMSINTNINFDLFSFMYGSIATVSAEDIYIMAVVSIIIILFIKLFFKELVYITFDEQSANYTNIPVKLINNIFIVLVAASITITLRIVGVLLVSSLIIMPVASSLKIAKSLKGVLSWAIIFGELAIISGVILSYYLDIAPGGVIIIISVSILLLTTITSKFKHKKITLLK